MLSKRKGGVVKKKVVDLRQTKCYEEIRKTSGRSGKSILLPFGNHALF